MKFKYPKIAGFIVVVALAYIIFSSPSVSAFVSSLNSTGYLGAFIAGMFYTFGFTSPISAGFFIDLNPSSILLAGVLGGIGSLIGDMLIFDFIRFSFMDEFKSLGKEKPIKWVGRLLEKLLGKKIVSYVVYLLAVAFIASPLPDEAGITLLAGFTKIKASAIAVIGIISNTIGIIILLSI